MQFFLIVPAAFKRRSNIRYNLLFDGDSNPIGSVEMTVEYSSLRRHEGIDERLRDNFLQVVSIPRADIRIRLLCTETIVYGEYHMTRASSNIPGDRGSDKTSDIPKVRCV